MVLGFVVDGVAGLMVGGGTVARGLFVWCAFVPPKTFSWYILLKKSANQTEEVAVV